MQGKDRQMEFTYKKATIEDEEILVETRIDILRAVYKVDQDIDMSEIAAASRAYYRNSFKADSHVAYLVYQGDTFVGAGGVSFYQVMPTYDNPTGEKAYIMNMYTVPEYRRQGIAITTLDLLVGESKARGITFISLDASDLGRRVYEKYGFVQMEDEMRLK